MSTQQVAFNPSISGTRSTTETERLITVDLESKLTAPMSMINLDGFQSHPYRKTSYGNEIAVNNNNVPICIEAQPRKDRRLPVQILKLLHNLSKQEIIDVLKRVQDAMKNIWKEIDRKYERLPVKPQLWLEKCGAFRIQYQSYLFETFSSEASTVVQAMEILRRSSFGGLILNSKNEILAVRNYPGTWSALKGHRKIKENGKLETIWETFLRELFEEISIQLETDEGRIKLSKKNICDYLESITYLKCRVDSKRSSNDRDRHIGLFVFRIDETNLHFQLADTKENQNWMWLKIDDILNNNPEPARDMYYTLRPFVQYLKNHPKLLRNH